MEQYVQVTLVAKGTDVLTGSYDGTLQVWTVEQPKCIFSFELDDKIKCVEWLTLGAKQATFVSGGFDQVANIWSWNRITNAVTCVAACRGHSETVMCAAAQRTSDSSEASPNLFVTGSWDGTIRLWSGSQQATDLSDETGGIVHVRKSTTKVPTRAFKGYNLYGRANAKMDAYPFVAQCACESFGWTLFSTNLHARMSHRVIPRLTLAGHRETVTCVCWLPVQTTINNSGGGSSVPTENQLISSSWDHTLRVWDCQAGAGTEVRSIVSTHAIHDMDAAEQGILVASSDSRVRVFDLRAGESLAQIGFHGHTGWLTSVAWAPHRTDQFVTGSIDRSVRLWDTRNTRSSLYDLMGHADMVTDVDWAAPIIADKGESTNKHFILSSSADGTVKVYHYPA